MCVLDMSVAMQHSIAQHSTVVLDNNCLLLLVSLSVRQLHILSDGRRYLSRVTKTCAVVTKSRRRKPEMCEGVSDDVI